MSAYLERPAGWRPDRLAERYDETSFWSAQFGALLFRHLEVRRGISGLDVGCGTGFPLLELAQRHGASSHFTGIDPWTDGLERARTKLELLGLSNVTLALGDAGAMPFADRSFDLIVANLGINNFEDPGAAFRECRRVIAPGGRFILTTNVRGLYDSVYRELDTILAETGLHAERADLEREEAHRLVRDELAALATEHGFVMARAFDDLFEMRFADGASMLNHTLVKWFLDPWREAVGVENEGRVFAELERRLGAGGLRMPVPMLYLECTAT